MWLAVVALAATAGCSTQSGHGNPAAAGSAASSNGAGSSPSASASSTPQTPVAIESIATMSLPHTNIGPLALADSKAVFPFAADGGPDWNAVGVLDGTTNKERVAAHTEYDHGLISRTAATGDWLVWVDQSRRQSDADLNVLWRIHALNTGTGQEKLLASNGEQPDPYVPVVHAGDGYVFWTEPEADRSARETVWSPGWTRPRTLLSHVEMTPGSETAANGHLVYLSKAAPDVRHGRRHTIGGDCWTTPLDGSGTPTPLSHTALAMGCAATRDGELVWSEHIDPQQRPLPDDGLLDDPYKMQTITSAALTADSRVAGGASGTPGTDAPARLLHRGYISFGYPVAGSGFAVWRAQSGRVVVRALSSTHQALLPSSVDSLSVASDGGDLLGYVSTRGKTDTITLTRVVIQ
jgi:hypothetical protein